MSIKDRSVRIFRGNVVTYSWNPSGTSTQSDITTLSRWRDGTSNPQWRTQIARQENATTNMTGVYDTYTGDRGAVKLVFLDDWGNPLVVEGRGDLSSMGHKIDWSPGINYDVADNRALIAYLKRCRAAQQSFQGLTFLGELRESLRMLRHPAQGLANLANTWIKRVGREKARNPRNWKGNLSSMWLEQAFGWQPLVSDINSAFKTFRGLRDSKVQKIISGFGIEEANVPGRTGSDWYGFGLYLGYRYNQKAIDRAFVRYKGAVAVRTYGAPVDALEPFGFTFDSFLPTAWELLPWSFLIDYFSNIGDVIEAGTWSRAGLRWTCKTSVLMQISERQGFNGITKANAPIGNGTFVSCEGSVIRSRCERRTVSRNADAVVGVPTLSFEIPGIPAQWANMTALFAQANAVSTQRPPHFRK